MGAEHPTPQCGSVWLCAHHHRQQLGSLTSNLNLDTCLPLSFPWATKGNNAEV